MKFIILFCTTLFLATCNSTSKKNIVSSIQFTSDSLPLGFYASSSYGKKEHLSELNFFGNSKREYYALGAFILMDTICIWMPVTSREAAYGTYYYKPSFDDGLKLDFITDTTSFEMLSMKRPNSDQFKKDISFSVQKFSNYYLLRNAELEVILNNHFSFNKIKEMEDTENNRL